MIAGILVMESAGNVLNAFNRMQSADRGGVAAKERHEFDDAVAVIEEQDREDLVIMRGEMEAQVVARVARVRDRGTAADAVGEDRAGGVENLVRGGGSGGRTSQRSRQWIGRERAGE